MDWLSILLLVLVFLFTIFLVYSYAVKSTPPHIYFLVFCGWLFAFEIVALIPYDVYVVRLTQAVSGQSAGPLHDIWLVMYWSVNALCWVLLPLSQAYQTAGDFTFWRRMGTAVFNHVRTYIVVGIAGGAILLYLLISGHLTSQSASAVLVVMSMFWGLFLVIVLLGYGLVEVPRKMWYSGSHALSLKYLQFKAAKLDEAINDAKYTLSECMKKVNASRKLSRADRDLEPCVAIIAEKVSDRQCPAHLLEYHNSNRTHEKPEIMDALTPLTRAKLVKVHCDFIKATSELRRSKW
jgi:hypothetical protein